jgi:hypothetical protein
MAKQTYINDMSQDVMKLNLEMQKLLTSYTAFQKQKKLIESDKSLSMEEQAQAVKKLDESFGGITQKLAAYKKQQDALSGGAFEKSAENISKLQKELTEATEKYKEWERISKAIASYNYSDEEKEQQLAKLDEQYGDVAGNLYALEKQMKALSEAPNPLPEDKMKVKSVTEQFRELRREMADLADSGQMNSERFRELAQRSAEMRVAIADTNMQISIMESTAVSAGEGMRTAFSKTGGALKTLDFANANRGLAGLNQAMSQLDVQKMSKDFIGFSKVVGTTMVNSLKVLGKTFVSVGRAILANPIFLLAAIIIGVVVAIVKLAKNFEFFQKVLDGLMMPLNLVVAGFKKLTDWIGLTNHAEQEYAEEQAKRAQERSKQITQSMNDEQGALSRQIAIIQAKGDLSKEEEQQVYELQIAKIQAELEKQKVERESLRLQIENLKVKGKLTDEEKEQLEELQDKYHQVGESIKDVNNQITVSALQRNAKLQADEKKAEEERAQRQKQAWEKRKQELKIQGEKEAELKKQATEFIAKIEEETKLNAIKDDDERAYQKLMFSLAKERETALANTQLTEEQKIKIRDYFRALEDKAMDDWNAKKAKKESELNNKISSLNSDFEDKELQAKIDRLKAQGDEELQAKLQISELSFEQQKKALQKERESIVKEYEDLGLATTEINAYFDEQEQLQLQAHLDEMDKIRKDDDERQLQKILEKYKKISDVISKSFASVDTQLSKDLSNIGTTLLSGISSITEVLNKEGATIAEKVSAITDAVFSSIQSVTQALINANKQGLDEHLQNLDATYNEEQNLLNQKLQNGLISQEQADKAKFDLEMKKYNAEEKAKKQAFERDKKYQIAQATVGMLQGMTMAFISGFSSGIPFPGNVILGTSLSALVGAMGAVNIAKIASTKYNAGTPPSAPSSSSISTPKIDEKTQNQTVDLFKNEKGGSEDTSNKPQPQQNGGNDINVTVSVSEITDTQKKVAKYEELNTI